MSKIPRVMVGWRVLVVDDEPDSLEVARMMLEMAGAYVLTATNGKEGLASVDKERPHFILSDLSMPEMDGWHMMQELNRERSTADIPVIALTAHAMSGDRERAMQAGFVNYIPKPLDPDKFINQLLNIVTETPELRAVLPNSN
jgi:CheY-like chemotaxis protein